MNGPGEWEWLQDISLLKSVATVGLDRVEMVGVGCISEAVVNPGHVCLTVRHQQQIMAVSVLPS